MRTCEKFAMVGEYPFPSGKREAQTFHLQLLADKWVRENLEKIPAENRAAPDPVNRQFPNRAEATEFANAWMAER